MSEDTDYISYNTGYSDGYADGYRAGVADEHYRWETLLTEVRNYLDLHELENPKDASPSARKVLDIMEGEDG
jgi:flagellar biosynthesis/type III secretory pathway protein FliH